MGGGGRRRCRRHRCRRLRRRQSSSLTGLHTRLLQVPLLALMLMMMMLTLSSTAAAAVVTTTTTEDDDEYEKHTCNWEDEQGKKKCREEIHRWNNDPYLPSNEGGRDYLDDDNYEYDDYDYDGGESIKYDNDKDKDKDTDTDNYGDDDYYYYFSKPEEGEEWDVWKHGGKTKLYDVLNCPSYDFDDEEMFKDTSFENIHTAETWQTFNKIYNQVIAETGALKATTSSSATATTNLKQESSIPPAFEKNGFQFPIEIKFQPVVGRGVYATTDIPKGSLLYLSTNNAAFYEGQTFRNFLKALPEKLACDIMIWSFVRWVSLETAENEKHMVCVDLDEGSFINSANDEDDYNMALGNDDKKLYHDDGTTDEERKLLWEGCKMKFFASRDITAGEEIRADYADFVESHGWRFLGL